MDTSEKLEDSPISKEIHDMNLKIKSKIPIIFIYILALVIIFQAGVICGIFASIKYCKKQVEDSIVAEAFIYNEYDKNKFTDKKVIYSIKKYEVIQEINQPTSK